MGQRTRLDRLVSWTYPHLPQSLRRIYWDIATRGLERRYGQSRHDYEVLSRVIDAYGPQSVLDIGCGAGRLFPLFRSKGIPSIVGVDLSHRAIELAHKRYNGVTLIDQGVEQISFPRDSFDLVVSNRVLQCIKRDVIDAIVGNLCYWSPTIYINELTASDGLQEAPHTIKHDYKSLFSAHGYEAASSGVINSPGTPGFQTYYVFTRAYDSHRDNQDARSC